MSFATILGLEPAESTLLAALVAGFVGLYLNYRRQRGEAGDRRRTLHGEAYQAALEWCEGVWRVRRRPKDGSGDDALVQHFHAMQEKIAFYEGWLNMEDRHLGGAYRVFLEGVMSECRELIQDAWRDDGRHPSEQAPVGERNPDVQALKEAFLTDARDLASRWPWVRHKARRRIAAAGAPAALSSTPTGSSLSAATPDAASATIVQATEGTG